LKTKSTNFDDFFPLTLAIENFQNHFQFPIFNFDCTFGQKICQLEKGCSATGTGRTNYHMMEKGVCATLLGLMLCMVHVMMLCMLANHMLGANFF
jgi:hypothetical protein